MLDVKDLVRALRLAEKHMGANTGRAFNIRGGPANSIGLLLVLELSGEFRGSGPCFPVGNSHFGIEPYGWHREPFGRVLEQKEKSSFTDWFLMFAGRTSRTATMIEAVKFWNEPSNVFHWDSILDPDRT